MSDIAATPPPVAEVKDEAKYGSTYVANVALLALIVAAGWLWFTAHVKPHISTALFGSVSFLAICGVGATVLATFFDKNDLIAALRRKLESDRLTPALLLTMPPLLVAYGTTFSLYLTQADGVPAVRASVSTGRGEPRVVELSSAEKTKAVTYFFAFRGLTANVQTIVPAGYVSHTLDLRRGIPLQLTVPNAADARSAHLVRILPLYNLFNLLGHKERDSRYTIHIFLPGVERPIVRTGLNFNAIYIGARVEELQAQSKVVRASVADLRDTLRALDNTMTSDDINNTISAWLDAPEFIATPELKQGQQVRIVLDSPEGKTETTVKINGPVTSAFLEAGSSQ